MAKNVKKLYVLKGFKSGWHTFVSPRMHRQEQSRTDRGIMFGDESWADVKNVRLGVHGTVQKRRGSTHKGGQVVDGPVNNIIQYYLNDGTWFLLAFWGKSAGVSSSAYKFAGATWTEVGASGSDLNGLRKWVGTINNKINGAVFNDKLVVTNGTDDPHYWNGSDTKFTKMPSTCYPGKFVKNFRNYLFMINTTEGGTTYNSRVRWSDATSAFTKDNWPAANYIDLDPDDGEAISGAAVLGNMLVIFKRSKIYAISYIGGPWMFDYTVKVPSLGCVSGTSVVEMENQVFFLSGDGFYRFDGSGIAPISEKIKDRVLAFDADYHEHVVGAQLAGENQVWWTVPYAGDDIISVSGGVAVSPTATKPCNEVWVYDYDNEAWTRYDLQMTSLSKWKREDTLTLGELKERFDSYDFSWDSRFGLATTDLLVGGDYRGYISDMDIGSVDGNSVKPGSGTGIDAYFKTQWIDFGDPLRTDRLMRMYAMVAPQGLDPKHVRSLEFTIRTDWAAGSSGTSATIPLSGDTSIPTLERRIDWTRQGRSFQLEVGPLNRVYGGLIPGFYSPTFELDELVLEYVPKGRTANPTYG